MSSLHWPPLPPELIADSNLSDRCFRAFARLYTLAWNGTFLTPVRLTEDDLCAILHKSRTQMYSLLAEMTTAHLIHWHRDGRHFRITPNFNPPVSTQPGGQDLASGKPDAPLPESGNPDSTGVLSPDFRIPVPESGIPGQGQKPRALKESIKLNDDDESSEDHHHHGADKSGFPDASPVFKAACAQSEHWLLRAGVWPDRAKKLARVLAANEQVGMSKPFLPTRRDVLGWVACLTQRDDIDNLPAILAQNLEKGRPSPAKYQPPRLCQTCQRAEGSCHCAQAAYDYPESLFARALDPTVHSWVCPGCHALPCACLSAPEAQIDELDVMLEAVPSSDSPPPSWPVELIGWDGSGVEPTQAWKNALYELQIQIPKATFDMWVRDTHLIRWENQGKQACFTVSCPNAYARDWLTARMTSTLAHILLGVCNRQVVVEFMVSNDVT